MAILKLEVFTGSGIFGSENCKYEKGIASIFRGTSSLPSEH